MRRDNFTFVSEAHNTVSWLDHCICTTGAHTSIVNIHIGDKSPVSDHLPLVITMEYSRVVSCVNNAPKTNAYCPESCVQWSSRSIETIELYTHQTEYKLCSITRAVEAESCTDVHCNNLSHIDAIDNLYCDIVTSLKSAARDSVDTANKNARGKPNNIPGWNDYVKGLRKNNYRPIAIANIVSKVLERIILMRIQHVVTICDNQFGFKKAQSTDLAIYTLKEVVQYYTARGSPVFACFLDVAKAFDRVNHCLLFNKLLDTGWPPSIVKTLYIWYGTQRFRVKWANDVSNRIAVSCGVRQGSILPPTLFNIYMNDLQLEFNGCRVGCHIGNLSCNNIAYADDMVLLSPSAKGLNCLLGICESYAKKHDVVYNTTKSKVTLFPCKTRNVNPKLLMVLDEDQMEQIYEYVYLGHVITPNLNDNLDIARKKSYLYKGEYAIAEFF